MRLALGVLLSVCSAAAAAAEPFDSAQGLERARRVERPPANTWIKLEEGGIGPRSSPGLVYVPGLGRLVLLGGIAGGGAGPYDVLSSQVGADKWRNEFPAGKSWGPEFGAASAPTWGSPYFTVTDKEGNCRPNLRNATMYFQYALDPDDNCVWAVIGGHTMRYDLAKMGWQDLGDKDGPGAGTGLALKWGALVYDPVNKELVQFGGAHGAPQRGGGQTWLFSTTEKKWRKLEPQNKVLDGPRQQAEGLRSRAKDLVAALRNRYYRTEIAEKAKVDLAGEVAALHDQTKALADGLSPKGEAGAQDRRQIAWAGADLADALAALKGVVATAEGIKQAERAERSLLRARDALEVQPPPRLLAQMAYDAKHQKVVLFGGDRWEFLCAETWLYDPKTRTWAEQRPEVSPSPRAGHALVYLPKSGRVLALGGYGYSSSMSYGASMYAPLPGEMWAYDVAANGWQLVGAFDARQWPPANSGCLHAVAAAGPDDAVTVIGRGRGASTWSYRVDAAGDAAGTAKLGAKPGATQRRSQCFDPDWFEEAPLDGAAVAAKLNDLPANRWVAMEPPKRITNHDWGPQIIDPDRDLVLFWAGGHCAYCGTDPKHYSLAFNRWSTSYSAEQQMEHCRDAGGGGYVFGCPFTGRPFSAHTYHAYTYDPATRRMYFADKSRLWAYDPDRRDWLPDAPALPFGFGTHHAALRATPRGLIVWRSDGGHSPNLWLQKEPYTGTWECLVASGKSSLPAHYCDSSSMVYDSKRERMLFVHFGQKEKQKIWVYDFGTKAVSVLDPKGGEAFPASAGVGRHALYLADEDLVILGTPAKPEALTLVYDCAADQWLSLQDFAGRDKNGKLIVPDGYGVSTGLNWDPKRKLIWAGDTCGGMFVMKFDRKAAKLVKLGQDGQPAPPASAGQAAK